MLRRYIFLDVLPFQSVSRVARIIRVARRQRFPGPPVVGEAFRLSATPEDVMIQDSATEGKAAAGAAQAAKRRGRVTKGSEKTTTARKRAVRAGKPKRGGKAKSGTKQEQLIAMLRRPEGASVEEVAKTLGWQAHTMRGAISGALKKKLGLKIDSEKVEGRGRVYRITD